MKLISKYKDRNDFKWLIRQASQPVLSKICSRKTVIHWYLDNCGEL